MKRAHRFYPRAECYFWPHTRITLPSPHERQSIQMKTTWQECWLSSVKEAKDAQN